MSDKVTISEQIEMGLIKVNDRSGSRYVQASAPSQTYQITPAQAQQLDRMTEPEVITVGAPTQTSQTMIDVGKFLEPIKVVEQFSPSEQADGIVKLA